MTLVEGARTLLGARWRHRGRKPWAVDCIGLVLLAARAAGLQVEDTRIRYGREPLDGALRSELATRFGAPVDDWSPGDIAVIRWGRGDVLHLGILGDHPDGLSLIHVHSLHGVVEHALAGRYRDAVVEVYRWPA